MADHGRRQATVAPTARQILARMRGPEVRKAREELQLLEDSLRGAITTILLMQEADKEHI